MKRVLYINTLIIAGLFFIGQQSFAQETANDDFEKMKFEVVLNKNNYILAEPMFIRFTFSNQSGKALKTYDPEFINETIIKVRYRGEISVNERLPSVSGMPGVRFPQLVLPNGILDKEELIGSAFVGYFFPEAGNYQIQFILNSSDGTKFLESNIVDIQIVQPQGIDRDAFNFLNEHKKYFGVSPWVFNKREGEQLLEIFVEKYGHSVYGEIAINSLGYLYLAKGELEKSELEFEKIKSSRNSIIARDASISIESIKKKKNALKKANNQIAPN